MNPIYVLLLVSCWLQTGECTTYRRNQAKTFEGHGESVEGELPFSYDPKSPYAPSKWKGDCQNEKQSPINIKTDLVQYESMEEDTEYVSYKNQWSDVFGEFENNGHTATFTVYDHGETTDFGKVLQNVPDFDSKDKADGESKNNRGTDDGTYIYDVRNIDARTDMNGESEGNYDTEGDNNRYIYDDDDTDDDTDEDDDPEWVFYETHFHIGGIARNRNRSRFPPPGSEHTVDGYGYDGEIHIVHWRRDENAHSFDEAAHKDDGLLAVGVFFNVVEEHGGEADRIITEYVSKVLEPHNKTFAFVNPSLMLPQDGLFYRYKGSKTTPPCHENVLWIVYKTPITISRQSYAILEKVITEEVGHPPLVKFGNNRPVQRDLVEGVKANFPLKKNSEKGLLRRLFEKQLRKTY